MPSPPQPTSPQPIRTVRGFQLPGERAAEGGPGDGALGAAGASPTSWGEVVDPPVRTYVLAASASRSFTPRPAPPTRQLDTDHPLRGLTPPMLRESMASYIQWVAGPTILFWHTSRQCNSSACYDPACSGAA